MSDLNDDLLNDELDAELDAQALLGADEDELLLSDEELERDVSSETKAQLKDDAEKWVSLQLSTEKETVPQHEEKKVEDVVTTSSTCTESSPQSTSKESDISVQIESDVSTSEESPTKHAKQQLVELQSKNDEVTSTNKEIEDQSVSQTIENPFCGPKQQFDVVSVGVIQSSQESTSATEEMSSDPREDAEDRGERTNIKQSVERNELAESLPEKYHPGRFFPAKRGRGMVMRGAHFPGMRPLVRYPHLNYQQYPPHPNENINPQAQNQYFPYNPMDPSLNARPPFPQNVPMGPRSEYRPSLPPGFRAQNPNDFTIYRGPRPEFSNHVNGAPFNNFNPQNQMRPMFRPDGNLPMQQQRFEMRVRMPIQRLPGPGMPVQGNPPYIPTPIPPPQGHPMPPNSQHPGNMSIVATPTVPGQSQTVMPRKVLINPNFKGGVEAAKTQLMKDTHFMQTIGPHVSHLQSDEELLRQQEEFINKNRLHIEKRRNERSPERRRSRERSYSPVRRERRDDSRERRGDDRGRRRRAGSRDFDVRDMPKRRRSGSPYRRHSRDRFDDYDEEDEETRAYRQEIEKQKAMREKILRDKEMRRRMAAEGKQGDEKPIPEEGPTKLTPVVVTGSKIISLKKKQSDAASQAAIKSVQQAMQQTIQRTIPTAKILPETKRTVTDHIVKDACTGTSTASLAVIKPVVKKTINVQADMGKDLMLNEDDLLQEELLLADTPSPPTSPKPSKTVGLTLSEKSVSCNSGGNSYSSSNRRVVLKSSKDQDSHDARKGIYDRISIEKKIGVNESVKRKIQRIVIKNAEYAE